MAGHTSLFKVTTMSRALEVSRSGFYAWRNRLGKPSAGAQRRDHLDEVVKAAFVAGESRSGSPRLTLDLADAGKCTIAKRSRIANSAKDFELKRRRNSKPPRTQIMRYR